MTRSRQFIRSWSGGIISPELFGRLDDARYQQGADTIENFVCRMGGSLQRRPGWDFVRETKDSSKASRLIPFVYSTGQAVAVEMGEEYFRFHADGATLLYIEGIPVASVDTATERITFSRPHGLVADEQIRFLAGTGGTLPSFGGSGYFTRLVDAYTIELSSTSGGAAINITSTGTLPFYCYRLADEPAEYISSRAFSSVSTGADTITTSGAHNLTTGDPIEFTLSGGTLPTYADGLSTYSLQEGVVYYAIVTGASVIQVATTQAKALAGTELDLNGAGSGTPIVHYYYTPGQTVTHSTPDGYFRCIQAGPKLVTPGTTTHWEQMPSDGTLETASPYQEADLFDVHYAQSADIKTLVHQDYPPAELSRLSATNWAYQAVVFNDALAAPTGASMTPTSGATSSITAVSAATPASFTTSSAGSTDNLLSKGDLVYINEPAGNTVGSVPSNTFYVVLTAGATTFTLRQVSGGAVVSSASTTITGSPTVRVASASSEITAFYRITSVDGDGRESAGSNATGGVNNLLAPGAYNTITWNPVANATGYNVYKARNGLYGFIGRTTALSFVDDNIDPDMSVTLPEFDTTLASLATQYPGAVAYFEGRRVFGGTPTEPQSVWMTNVGQPESLAYGIPVQDDDRIRFEIESQDASTVRHLIPSQFLLALTDSTEYRIGGVNNDAITPDNVSVRPQSYVGGSNVQPVLVDRTVVFVGQIGNHLFEMGWTANEGYQPADLCLRAPHLFDGETVVDMAFQKSPVPIVWAVTSAGRLLGMTYAPGEQVGGWHAHSTQGGFFESVCAIPEGNEHRLYAIVRRTIDGATVRNVERMGSLYQPATLAESRHMDGGGQFYGMDTSGKTLTVTPASSWASGSTVTLAGTMLFRLGSADVGDYMRFPYQGNWFLARVTSVTNGSSAAGVLVGAVTNSSGATPTVGALPSIASTSWGWQRDSLSELDHLEGETLQVLADGVLYSKTVASGVISGFSPPALRITYGLPIESTLRTLPVIYGSESYGQAATVAVNKLWLRTRASAPFKIGRDLDTLNLVPVASSFDEPNQVTRTLTRGQWDESGQVYVFQDQPYPLTLVSMTVEMSIGS